ncbi:MAG TPA: type II secretion system F family protein [Mycobacteriales bacterium]|nr:type II secretion system F family protein [Mycobacteriales bacterium]
MTGEEAAALAGVAVLLAARPHQGRRRLGMLIRRSTARVEATRPAPALVAALAAGAAALFFVTVGGVAGAVAAAVVVLVARRRRAPEPPMDVPLVADLLASCLAAGASMADALRAAAAASPGSRLMCMSVADRLRRGTAAEDAWSQWLARPELAAVARVCVRSTGTGSATTSELLRIGDRLRVRRRAERARQAQRAGVWVVLPLGFCFLPAFVLVGIVPFAVGLIGH